MNTIHWLGLDSYNEKEASLFFGRQTEIEELSGDIFHNQQTIIYGPSGVGKTSIIKAGIFTKARKKDFLPVYIRLSHNDDEISYSKQIISAICQEAKDKKVEIEQTVQYIDKNDISLWEFFHCNKFWSMYDLPVIPLFVIDQFEELFTLGKSKTSSEEFFSELADLCDNLVPKYVNDNLETSSIRIDYPKTVDYRLVLSLREDFLPRLEEYADHIPALKRNRYSLQAINEEQAMDIIMKPEEGLVDKDVAITIIQKVTNRTDFKIDGIPEIDVEPSLLSLFCSVLDKKRVDREEKVISKELVNEFGENIIQDFYNEKISQISEKAADYIEDKLLTGDGFRDSVALNDALHQGMLTKEELDILQKSRLIRIEDKNGAKRIESTHDVLCKVAKEHKDNKQLIKDKELEQQKLQIERQKRTEIEQKAAEEKKRSRKKIRKLTYTIIFIFVIICGVIYTIYDCFYKPYSECYLTFTKQYGWPVGVGEKLDKEDCEHLRVYCCLSRKGRLSTNPFLKSNRPFTSVETLNDNRELTENNDVNIPLVDKDEAEMGNDNTNEAKFARLLSKACRWSFLGDAEGNVYKEIVYSKFGEVLYVYNITNNLSGTSDDASTLKQSSEVTKKKSLRGTYYDKDGNPIILRNNGAQTILIAYDDNGYEEQYQFFDAKDEPCSNYNKAYGVLYEHDDLGRIISVRMLDQVENILNPDSCSYNCSRYSYIGKTSKIKDVKYFLLQKYKKPVSITLTDAGGRDSVKYLYSPNGMLMQDTCAITKYKYNGFYRSETIRLTSQSILGIPTSSNSYSRITYVHDNLGHIINKKYYTGNKLVYEERYKYETNISKYDAPYRTMAKDLMLSFISFDYLKSPIGIEDRRLYDKDCINSSISYYDTNGNKIYYGGYHEYSVKRLTMNDSINIKIIKFFGTDGKLRNDGVVSLNSGNQSFATDSIVYINNLLVYDIHKDNNGKIVLSKTNYYDCFGNINGHSVIGLYGNPIHCSIYDDDKLLCYKVLKSGTYIKCVNEFGEEDYIQFDNGTYYDRGFWYQIPKGTPSIVYLYLTSINSNAYKAGIRDNDILLDIDNWKCPFENIDKVSLQNKWSGLGKTSAFLRIARLINNKYVVKKIKLSRCENVGMEYSVFYVKSRNLINKI